MSCVCAKDPAAFAPGWSRLRFLRVIADLTDTGHSVYCGLNYEDLNVFADLSAFALRSLRDDLEALDQHHRHVFGTARHNPWRLLPDRLLLLLSLRRRVAPCSA